MTARDAALVLLLDSLAMLPLPSAFCTMMCGCTVGRGFRGCKPIYAFRRMVWLIHQRHTPYALSGPIGSWAKRGKLQWVVGTSREERHKLSWIANAPAGEHGGERAGAQPPR
ncbi:uncharacterized protein CLUP02_00852 [Colletotrichum lupini]|uniref:Secreted protein n=3 Tax=Colletotrichum acutatum species complex TaxID=2707335 RepID=A0A9Q8SBJ9_9PEZI|nr:uncharacterized protein CLUP02_00852 [Colletotrichum lupini]XP_060307247.1 uncharacterized protein CCOS01_14007 [Colletotrichum costaricense]XP_060385821.1 uncharacterized protein CTAM01_03580 [Colletotrichum tamarilloi]KAK1506245.1 hypothetical protein CTAM01_03580 [Colletotrichum tamarilloi]KAK1514067.1 hypothetical protein CCOS01_14007 [Colletotrichum costaricense]UQC74204.1 hypothetical protein CLUP02_00852 [Colletotrichum lupini]